MLSKTAHFALHCNTLDAVALPDPATGLSASPLLFPEVGVWLGAMVPKRWAKRAVTRNAIKRQIYAVGAQYEAALSNRAHLVRLRSTFDRAQFVSASSDALKSAVRLELLQLFERMQRQPAATPGL
jgi:ribonuclease P protein component